LTRPISPGRVALALPGLLAFCLAGCGGAPSTAAPAPVAQAQIRPASTTLSPGASATFTADIAGVPAASLTWSATGGKIAAHTSAGGALSGTFVAGTAPGEFTVQLAQVGHPDQPLATAAVTIAAPQASSPPPPPPPSPAAPPRLFSASAAAWLYSAPTGPSLDISSITSGIPFTINVHATGFDYPVAYTDGTHGCTTFTDTLLFPYRDRICVPNPAGGFFPATGKWGADDGHLVVVDTATRQFYDFWKLSVNAAGRPTSTNVGQIVQGNLAVSDGTPGTTAAGITGLAGDILPGELSCVTCLNHALNVVVPGTMNSNLVGHQVPARKTDGTVRGAIFREGAKIRFDPSVDVNTLPVSVAVKALMRALQLYGGVITDQTGGRGITFYSALGTAPDLTGIDQIGRHLWLYY
jgi:hypothetical protein